mgnify:CR=1 FL=1
MKPYTRRKEPQSNAVGRLKGVSVSNSDNSNEKKDAEDFIANKSKFFGLVITDEEIIVKVLESIDEYYNEGKTQNICVFGSEYYKKADTLILSARIGGEIIETVEVDLRTSELCSVTANTTKTPNITSAS